MPLFLFKIFLDFLFWRRKIKILVTGVAGFIGYHLTIALLEELHEVIGIDNMNNYYDASLKESRLSHILSHKNSDNFKFYREDICNQAFIKKIFMKEKFNIVINLAAQAGVRYSLEKPYEYMDSNVSGFLNILEGCRYNGVNHLIFASSSSVYGMNIKQPFSVSDNTDFPVSLYAATKKTNELMAFSYSHLFKIPVTGLRFFTVYGPFGRPDMAYYKFTKAILKGDSIEVFNNGEMLRDFTYIDDIILGLISVLKRAPEESGNSISFSNPPYKIYNIGNNNPVRLKDFISTIERACKRKAKCINLPMQPGDVPITYADIDDIKNLYNFKPKTNISTGIKKFVDWYINYYSND
jgi:UDP-glucuronate 4-epimerase